MELINQNLRYIRKQLGLTQETMAYQLGISRPALGSYEEGRAVPKWNVIHNLADISGIAVDELTKKDLLTEEREISTDFLDKMDNWQPRTDDRYQFRTQNYSGNGNGKSEAVAQKELIEKVIEKGNIKFEEQKPEARQSHVSTQRSTALQTVSVLLDENELPTISFIAASRQKEYIQQINTPDFLVKQPRLQFPFVEKNQLYRSFEAPKHRINALNEGAIITAKYIRNWTQLKNGVIYVIVSSQDLFCAFIDNQLDTKNTIIILPDGINLKEKQLPANEIIEIWEAQWFTSSQLPQQDLPQNQLTSIVLDLQQEMIKLKNRS